MDSKKQSSKKNHVVIVTSDAADASVKQFRIKNWVVCVIVIILCVLIGAGLGYMIYEDQIWSAANGKIDAYKDIIKELETEIEERDEALTVAAEEKETLAKTYNKEIESMNEKLTIMSETINQKVAEVDALNAQLSAFYNPILLPLTGSASIEVPDGTEPTCIFTASEGAIVVATASGTVTELVEETEYGYRIVIDHGNGYSTVYRNAGEPKVKAGDKVTQGVTLFVIDVTNTKLAYQVMQDSVYINPMDIMQISG